jgi:alpha-beta hydrolase superfamily lysophospholipase
LKELEMQHAERTITLPTGQHIAVYEWKPEQARGVVVLVHGMGEHAGRYEHVAAAFNRAGYALRSFDLPGHGKSDGTRGHIASNALSLDLVAGQIAEAQATYPGLPCFLYGHSMGGNIVLFYLLQRKPRLAGAIVTSPGLGTAEPVPAWKTLLGKAMYNMAPSLQMPNGLALAGLSRDPAVVAAYNADPLVHGKVSVRLGMDVLSNGREIIARAAEFPPVPLLLMQGSKDIVVSPQLTDQFAKGYSGDLTYKVWDGMYHELHNEPEQQAVLDTMIHWLDQHTVTV